MMNKNFLPVCITLVIGLLAVTIQSDGLATTNLPDPYADYGVPVVRVVPSPVDTVPIRDRNGDFINDQNTNPFDLNDPSIIEQSVEYDPESGNYLINEKIGDNFFYRPPSTMTFEEYQKYQAEKQRQEYFRELGGFGSGDRGASGKIDPIAKIDVSNTLVDRLFGGTDVKIEPSGNIDITALVNYQRIDNPSLLERQRVQWNPRFNMAIQTNVEGQIGEKLKLNTSFNNQATFGFDNQIKLDYNTDAFTEDDILKKIEAGNVALPLRGTLIQGSQSLFGLKTEVQFGRLRLTGLAANQNAERRNLQLQSGGQVQNFEVRADQYDENRHFFLTHYNRETFEESLEKLPQIQTLFRIEKLQVFVTNDRNEPFNNYEVVAVADVGEPQRLTNSTPDLQPPSIPLYTDLKGRGLPDNGANPIYQRITNDRRSRQIDRVVSLLRSPGFNLQQGQDFEKINARKLNESEYDFHPELGFISINTSLRPDQVVGVSFQYSYGDTVYQVGEFANDIQTAIDSVAPQNVVFVKMLKSATQRIGFPTWDLMMKNVYAIGAFNVNRDEFRLDITYDDPGAGRKRFLPESNIAGKPLIQVFNLDKLNVQGDPQQDGVFDFIPGLTINPRNGRIMFPVLEPFGSHLKGEIESPRFQRKYVYDTLYNGTVTTAREFANLNRFVIEGQYKSTVSSEIQLGAFNLPPNSLRVTAGGVLLRENIDYEVNYSSGTVKILNTAYLQQGTPINVDFEDNSLFNFQRKTMLALRADYELNKNLSFGGTFLNLFERPFTQKVNIGDDPINNKVYGLDINYTKESEWLTRAIDKLPFVETKAPSSINFSAEAAILRPGFSRAIREGNNPDDEGDGKGGVNYIDDFEGAVAPIFLGIQPNTWQLASVPQNDNNGSNPLFPESDLINNELGGVNRARLSWYLIEGRLGNEIEGNNPYEIPNFNQQEVFPNFTPENNFANILRPFTMSFDPTERGPYNYDVPNGTAFSAGVDIRDGSDTQDAIVLREPQTRWGGIQRALNVNDFEASNVEFIEFWMLSPFLAEDGSGAPHPDADLKEGDLYFNIGNISEDILRDSRWFFENGLPGPNNERRVDETSWGVVPRGTSITNAFDIDLANREAQDIGLDGLNDVEERNKFSDFVSAFPVGSDAAQAASDDPSNDNWVNYRSDTYRDDLPITARYRRFNMPEGNSPIQDNNSSIANLPYTNFPDSEDLDRDNSLSETEAYFQYRVPMRHDGNGGVSFEDNPFVTDVQVSDDGTRQWFRFKVPLFQTDDSPFFRRVGGINDFRAIRFIRMYMTGFEEQVTLRFATLDLVRNQWRRYRLSLKDSRLGLPVDEGISTSFDVNEVNIEENSDRFPFSYVLPPGLRRERSLSINANAQQNEASLSLNVCGLQDGDARAIYKLGGYDLRFFERLRMYTHAERVEEDVNIEDGDMRIFIRVGSDFTQNYYEYEIPLTLSVEGSNIPTTSEDYKRIVWPAANDFDVRLDLFRQLKLERNANGTAITEAYPVDGFADPDRPEGILRVKGNPNLGEVTGVMIGVRNPKDDGRNHCVEVWINELRGFGIDNSGGMAALGRLDVTLADLGNVSLAGSFDGIGYGGIDQPLLERSREQTVQLDAATNLELAKFTPSEWGLRLPFYAQYSQTISNPQFDPYDLDIELDEKLNSIPDGSVRDSVQSLAQEVTTIKGFSFTNVRKERVNQNDPNKKPAPWDIENFSATYAYSEIDNRDPLIERDLVKSYRGGIDYAYSRGAKYIAPLKKIIKAKPLKLLSEFNFNPIPNQISFSTVMDRQVGETKYRFASNREVFNTFYVKRWSWDRNYGLNWDITRSLKFNFNALNNAVIDEPDEFIYDEEDPMFGERIDQNVRQDSIWNNIQDLGRNKNYNHTFNVSYTLPIRFLPLLDFTNIKASYGGGYTWSAAALNVQSLGNVIQNNQDRTVNVDLDFTQLYNKSKYLRKINDGGQGARTRSSRGSRVTKDGEAESKENVKGDKDKKDDKKKKGDRVPSVGERVALRPLMALRRGRITFNEGFTTVIPGFQPITQYMGLSEGFNAPGWDFVAGWQPNINPDDYYTDRDWLYNNWQWISSDPLQNRQVIQTYSQRIQAQISLEPFKDFKVELEANRDLTRNHSERFASLEDDPNVQITQNNFEHLIPREVGSYQISYNAIKTFFRGGDELVEQFKNFEDSRVDIATRLGGSNPDRHLDSASAAELYPFGYGRYQQDVLIASFLAVYNGEDPGTVDVSTNYIKEVLLKELPKLNWRVTYNGLSKIPALKEFFKSVNITHGYKSTLQVNSYETDLNFSQQDPFALNQNTFDYFSRFELPDITITEAFQPLIGLDIRLNNGLQLRTEYKRARNLQMNFENRRLAESLTTDVVFGFSYKLTDFQFPFGNNKSKRSSKGREADNPFKIGSGNKSPRGGQGKAGDLDLTLDFSLRDDIQTNYQMDQDIAEPSRGATTIRLSPAAEYRFNSQLSLRMFMDYNRTDPKTSNTFPTVNTQGGLTLRFTLQ